MKKTFLAIAALIVLAGCQGVKQARTYADVPVVRFEHEGENWRIYDDTARNSLMTTPSFETASAAGFAQGLTLGLVDAMPDGLKHRQMIVAYMASTGRGDCTINEENSLVKGQFEFVYTCPTS